MTDNKVPSPKVTNPNQSLLRFMHDCLCESFVKEGKIRLTNIASYRTGDPSREDLTEGDFRISPLKDLFFSGSAINAAVYILSFSKSTELSSDEIKNLHKKFKCKGQIFLEIYNTELFLAKIKKTLSETSLDWLDFKDHINWVDVEYTYENIIEGCDITDFPENFHNYQKPKEKFKLIKGENDECYEKYRYEKEKECRLILDGSHKMSEEGSNLYKSWNNSTLIPELLKPEHLYLVCGDLSDCVRIKDIREL